MTLKCTPAAQISVSCPGRKESAFPERRISYSYSIKQVTIAVTRTGSRAGLNHAHLIAVAKLKEAFIDDDSQRQVWSGTRSAMLDSEDTSNNKSLHIASSPKLVVRGARVAEDDSPPAMTGA